MYVVLSGRVTSGELLEKIRKEICGVWVRDGGDFIRFACDERGLVSSSDNRAYNLFDVNVRYDLVKRVHGQVGEILSALYDGQCDLLLMTATRNNHEPATPNILHVELETDNLQKPIGRLLSFCRLVLQFHAALAMEKMQANRR